MKQIIFGTTNPGKVVQVQAALKPLGIKVLDLSGFDNLPEIIEDGRTAQENSRKKALAYCQAISQPVLSMDNALYFDNIEDNLQPGINVRRIPGHSGRPNDEETLKYYSGLINRHGGEITGHFEFAICLAFPDETTKETTAISKTRLFTSKISPQIIPGYPLESMQKDEETGKYISELTKAESDRFWQGSVGKELQKLFSSIN